MLSLLILLIWKLKQHLSGMAGAPGGTAQAQLSPKTPPTTFHPHPMHEANPSPWPRGCPCPPACGTGRAAELTLSQALAAERGEEEEGADHPGRLRHAGLLEGCSKAVRGLLEGCSRAAPCCRDRAAVCWGQRCWGSFMGKQRGLVAQLRGWGEDLVPRHVPKHRG